jgi:hypothetical protein
MGYWIVDGKKYNDEEYKIYQQQEQEAEERLRLEAEELARRLSETYKALGNLLRDNPNLRRQVRTDEEALHNEIYYKLLQNLARADQVPRCRWVKKDGTLCRSPQLKNHVYCYAHWEMMQRRARKISLPAVEDPNAIQLAIIEVQRCLIDHHISEKEAGLLLYSLQIAAGNVDRTTFGKARDEEMVREIADEEETIEAARRQDPTSPRKGFETQENGGDRSENSSPRMNTDDTDRAGPGKMLPQSAGEEAAQTYANSGGGA